MLDEFEPINFKQMWNPLLGKPHQSVCPFCGSPEWGEVQQNGHYQTTCCLQVTAGCCDGG